MGRLGSKAGPFAEYTGREKSPYSGQESVESLQAQVYHVNGNIS